MKPTLLFCCLFMVLPVSVAHAAGSGATLGPIDGKPATVKAGKDQWPYTFAFDKKHGGAVLKLGPYTIVCAGEPFNVEMAGAVTVFQPGRSGTSSEGFSIQANAEKVEVVLKKNAVTITDHGKQFTIGATGDVYAFKSGTKPTILFAADGSVTVTGGKKIEDDPTKGAKP